MPETFQPTLAAASPSYWCRSAARVRSHTKRAPQSRQWRAAVRHAWHHVVRGASVCRVACAGRAAQVVYVLGRRAYFGYFWRYRDADIMHSRHEGPRPENAYASEPAGDIRQAHTGVPVVDAAVRTHYARDMPHNHGRMWLTTSVVHARKVHWRFGADWLYGHPLDDELASNQLSWRSVVSTGSGKPYRFNADSMACYAPASWHSPERVIDQPYDAMDALARKPLRASYPGPGAGLDGPGTAEPKLYSDPSDDLDRTPPLAARVAGRNVWLVHPRNPVTLPAVWWAGVSHGLSPAAEFLTVNEIPSS